jgi:secondary thiamine-phosphate synthase enzyme
VRTEGNGQVLDITPRVSEELLRQTITRGLVHLFTPHSTTALTTIEYEPGLLRDFKLSADKLFPVDVPYHHNRGGEDNGHSHLRASWLGPSLSVPFEGKKLLLGTWQQIVLVDFDTRPRNRELIVQFLGEPS